MTLAELKPGQSADVTALDTTQDGVVRLMVLGLVEGARVVHRGAAIGGDPLEISIYGAAISIRREQANHVTIAQVKSSEQATSA